MSYPIPSPDIFQNFCAIFAETDPSLCILPLAVYELDVFDSVFHAEELGIRLPDNFAYYLSQIDDLSQRREYTSKSINKTIIDEFTTKIFAILNDPVTTLVQDAAVYLNPTPDIPGTEIISYPVFFYLNILTQEYVIFNKNTDQYLSAGSFKNRKPNMKDFLETLNFYQKRFL